MRSKGQSQNVFVRFITSPFRALGRARDFYVRSITKCGHNMNYSNPVDAAGRFAAFPRSYSANTSRSEESEDFAELVRAASARTMVDRIDMDLVLKRHATAQKQQSVESTGLPKSTSVGMTKIDEDKPYDFADGGVNSAPDLYPRSRSYAVGKRNVVF
ncbi:uncharacterized protein LOC129303825 [Prosopis cineraria]|uniref:uncharacterized protein LOC129295448 n=1 Tax=Prosopis cineraria TaxID=364024 RepID=UPI0024102A59|nr:uncharacterized protein LOC129295448 [Prosopis cineraria]XP_054799340.1 uncharacterized protein LOC129303825 [Prosopis cineraria]